MAVESARIGLSIVARLAYMFLGLLAAVSVSSSIFSALIPVKIDKETKNYSSFAPKISFFFVISTIIGAISIFLLPKTITAFPQAFKISLIVIHIAVLFPVLFPLSNNAKGDSARYKVIALYGFLAGISLVFHVFNTFEIILPMLQTGKRFHIVSFGQQLYAIFSKTNSCLNSVSIDISICALITILMILKFDIPTAIISLFLMPILSPAVIFPAFLLKRELSMIPDITPALLNKRRVLKSEEEQKKKNVKDKNEIVSEEQEQPKKKNVKDKNETKIKK